MTFEQTLIDRVTGIVSVTAEQVALLARHFTLLERWNEKINLTSITDLDEVVERHYCESLFLAAHLPVGNVTIVDIGSGAGFPGIPVAVYRPDCQVTLVESHQRKAVFLREASRGMANVTVHAGRALDLKKRFDWMVTRAVSLENLRPLLPMADDVAVLGSSGEIKLPWGQHRTLLLFHVKP